MKGRETPRHSILWDPHKQHPFLQTKEGIQRKQYNLYHRPEPSRVSFSYLSDVAVHMFTEDRTRPTRVGFSFREDDEKGFFFLNTYWGFLEGKLVLT